MDDGLAHGYGGRGVGGSKWLGGLRRDVMRRMGGQGGTGGRVHPESGMQKREYI